MTAKTHRYTVGLEWTGNRGTGTSGYRDFSRDHVLTAVNKPRIAGSSDPAFRGDAARWNPEELLLAALSPCHQLWYLHLCAVAGVIVVAYEDRATGEMEESADGGGQFVGATLHPRVTLAHGSDADHAARLHHDANAKCFIARSVTFPVKHAPEIVFD